MSKTTLILSLLGVSLLIFWTTILYNNKPINQVDPDIEVRLIQPEFFLSNIPNIDNVRKALDYYDILFPEIVLAQSILETGNYRSIICKKYNNLFGLYNSRIGDYFKFNHWTESVEAYRRYIQKKYHPPGDYFDFLDRIGYAEDPDYNSKVKQILQNNDKGTVSEGSSRINK